jgi:hypothetical protein
MAGMSAEIERLNPESAEIGRLNSEFQLRG